MGTSPLPVPPDALLADGREAYWETPSLGLRAAQVRRFFGLEPVMGVAMLEALLKEKFLCRTTDGLCARMSRRPMEREPEAPQSPREDKSVSP